MEGLDDEENRGVIPRAFEQIWSHINRTTGVEFLVSVRYLEIYMEEIRYILFHSVNVLCNSLSIESKQRIFIDINIGILIIECL